MMKMNTYDKFWVVRGPMSTFVVAKIIDSLALHPLKTEKGYCRRVESIAARYGHLVDWLD